MRVYLPTTLPGLRVALRRGQFGPAPIRAHAATAALARSLDCTAPEELEYAALIAAAHASLRALAADPDAPRRRVVIAADVADSVVEQPAQAGAAASAILVRGSVPLAKVASGHVDERAAMPDIARAVAGAAADTAADADGHELLWYATQELRYLFD